MKWTPTTGCPVGHSESHADLWGHTLGICVDTHIQTNAGSSNLSIILQTMARGIQMELWRLVSLGWKGLTVVAQRRKQRSHSHTHTHTLRLLYFYLC